jgi:hypothetical protein
VITPTWRVLVRRGIDTLSLDPDTVIDAWRMISRFDAALSVNLG